MAELAAAMEKVSDKIGERSTREISPTPATVLVQPEKTIDEIKTPRGVSKPKRSDQQKNIPKQVWVWIGAIVLMLIVVMVLVNQMSNKPLPTIQIPTSMASATQVISSVTQRVTIINTSIPTKTSQLSPTLTPVPTLGVGSTQVSPIDNMVMVYVPAGNFIMGSNTYKREKYINHPPHTVYLNAYWIDQTEVTNDMYQKCVTSGNCTKGKDFGTDFIGVLKPVVGVDWIQANDYCAWAGRKLPTEAQWEKAARGTDERTFPWGEGIDYDKANFTSHIGMHTSDVGSYPDGVSPYGALDMAGNVWEWVADWYGENYYSAQIYWSNPTGPTSGENRILRGGGFGNIYFNLFSYYRGVVNPKYVYDDYGFRCADSHG